ncbi:MAG: endo-1,4-beta-xylanase [Lewinella sp.]|nr:endo-1,4-beta-xylanase [Lewinella sp.]
MKTIQYLLIAAMLPLAFGCQQEQADGEAGATDTPAATLADAYADHFYVGAALAVEHFTGENERGAALVREQFNTITPENIMKWMHIHPAADSFAFELPDQFVAFGEANDMHLVGHTLVWHSQLAPWVQEVTDSAGMDAVLQDHIGTIVGRYRGRINGWDVVNEALNEDGSLRETIFLNTMGEGYLKRAFDLAAAADPEAELYYNDYNLCQPAKRAGCIEMIKRLQAAGAKIDGVGIQAHFSMNGPSLEEVEKSITEFAALGLKVMLTELDITVLPAPWDVQGADVNRTAEGSDFMNPYAAGLPDSVAVAQAERYEGLFRLLLDHEDVISRVTFWGVDDGHSWKNNWPIPGRTDYTLIFDRNQAPKMAYDSIMMLKRVDP